MIELNIEKILSYLPHRYPFVLIDRVLDAVPNESIRTLKNVTINEPYFQGHFPTQPIMPGVLQLEAMAQSIGVLAFYMMEQEGLHTASQDLFYFAGIDSARFKQAVVPGDQLIIDITLQKQKREIWKALGVATVDGKIVCSAELMVYYRKG